MPFYDLYELNHVAMGPVRAMVDMTRFAFVNPFNPWSHTQVGRQVAAACELVERATRRYGKPEFGLATTTVKGKTVSVHEQIIWERPFCNLLHFEREGLADNGDPRVLIVAPMSGHYATLLRGTVETFLPQADVYITDWTDARMVSVTEGPFDLDGYIDYLMAIFRLLGSDLHVVAVCQPSVPVLASVAVMEAHDDPSTPHSMVLMGGPIDTRVAPTAVNQMAVSRGIEWFHQNAIMRVPFPNPGFGREVYPGFLQLSGFMSMNLDRHLIAHREFFSHLVSGDGDCAERHREFYDEYLAVMDLSAEFYLQTVETVFIEHALPKGKMRHRAIPVDCSAIRRTGLMTIEGEKDDITGRGQTKAAHQLCSGLPAELKLHYEQPDVGHYGVFNGTRFREEIAPRMLAFMKMVAEKGGRKKAAKGAAVPEAMRPHVSSAEEVEANWTNTEGLETASPLTRILLASPKGVADDLKAISGIGPKLEKMLNGAGIFHYWQIAALTEVQIEALDRLLDFRGRIAREDWIGQAHKLSETIGLH